MEEGFDPAFKANTGSCEQRSRAHPRAGEGLTNSQDSFSSDLLLPTVHSFKRLSHLIHSSFASQSRLPQEGTKYNPHGNQTTFSKTSNSALDNILRIKNAVFWKESVRTNVWPRSQAVQRDALASATQLSLVIKTDSLDSWDLRDKSRQRNMLKLLKRSDSYRSLVEECDELLSVVQSLALTP